MESFDTELAQLLKAQPGLNKKRIADALKMEMDEDFRNLLDQACDREIAHKTMDKYYPGSRRAY